MSERWQREVRKLRDVEPGSGVWDDARARTPHRDDGLPPARQRIIAGAVAIAVFVGAGLFVWQTFRPSGSDSSPSLTQSVQESDREIEARVRELNDQIIALHSASGSQAQNAQSRYELVLERHAVCDAMVIAPLQPHSTFVEDFCSSTLRQAREGTGVSSHVQVFLSTLEEEIPLTERIIKGIFPGLTRSRLQKFDAEGPLYVYEFPTASALHDFRMGVSPDGMAIPTLHGNGTIELEWSPPWMYGDGRVLALYFGKSEATREALSDLLGRRFAPRKAVAQP
jgi:hypothetical protein